MESANISMAGHEIEALLRETQPRHLEALFRNTVEDAPVGIAFADREGRYRYCNRAFCAMLRFDTEELQGESMASLTHGADLESTTAGLERLWSGEIAHLDIEKRYLCKDGGALWVHATTSLVSGGGPTPECSVEFLLDISARKQMAAALLQNQTVLATVIAELPIALVACDVRGQLTHHNRAAAELLGIPAEEAVHAVPRNPYPLTSQVYLADGTTPVPREDRPLTRTLLGTEVGDLCEGQYFQSDAGYLVQRIWSNSAAAAGNTSPCIPLPQGDVYFNVSAEASSSAAGMLRASPMWPASNDSFARRSSTNAPWFIRRTACIEESAAKPCTRSRTSLTSTAMAANTAAPARYG